MSVEDNIIKKMPPWPYMPLRLSNKHCKIMKYQSCYGPGCPQSWSIVQCSIFMEKTSGLKGPGRQKRRCRETSKANQ